MNTLNINQQKAIEFKDGICAVIAVPGSGKTLTMMERIGILVNRHGIHPENILGLTFTKNAAEEMKHRLDQVLGEKASRVHLSTIHSFCHYLLRSESEAFDMLYGKDQIIFLKTIMKALKCNELSVGNVLREISLAKNNLLAVSEFSELHMGDKTMKKISEVYAVYEKKKYVAILKDFDDLLFDTYRLLTYREGIREKYRDVFTHILVDEYQDTNPAQMEIIKLLIGDGDREKGFSFWVCGDDAQSIYSFTGASVGNILNFQTIFPESELIILNLNYRSSKNILTACANLIKHNVKQIHKELKTDNPDGEEIMVCETSTEETEALSVINEVKDLAANKNYAYSDIAVLYRANFQSRVLEESFLQHKIPYHITNGMNFYHRHEVKVLLDYLRVISDPYSEKGDEALSTILNIPNRYISRKFVRDLERKATEKNRPMYDLLQSMQIPIPYIRKNIKEFMHLMDPLIEDVSLSPAEVINLLRIKLDYDRVITEDDIPSPDDSRIQNINQLQMAAGKYHSIPAFLEYTDSFSESATVNDAEGVSLMTIHKAKGLEFKVVMIVGLVEGILPSKKGDMEEERRICFVGMSRAMELLYLYHSQTYLGQPAKKSTFIDEASGNKSPDTTDEVTVNQIAA